MLPVVVEADRDVLQLAALLAGGDEVLAPVLGPLDRPAELHGRPRHQHLLGPRVHDLDAEAAADVGRDHLDLESGQAELGGEAARDAGRRLGGVPDPQLAAGRGPSAAYDAPRLHRPAAARARCRGRASKVCGAAAMAASTSPTSWSMWAATLSGHVVVDEQVAVAGAARCRRRRAAAPSRPRSRWQASSAR